MMEEIVATKCPRCQVDLMVSDCQGIEIDFCSQCRGVWLDRGELDKIVERASRFADRDDDDDDDDRERYRQRPYEGRGDRYYHKRRSFWSQLFD